MNLGCILQETRFSVSSLLCFIGIIFDFETILFVYICTCMYFLILASNEYLKKPK